MLIKKLALLGSLVLVCSLGQRAFAQTAVTGAIQGVVTDKATGDGLAGVTVVVTSPALQGTQSAITDGSGQYKITNLPPGTYSATFYYSDITVRRNNILVSINKTTPGYVAMNTSQAGGEVIVIDAKAPSIDPTSTTQGVTLDQDYTKNIPVPGRTFESALGAAAGSAGDDLGVSFSGSTSLENTYVVDGVNTTGLTYGTVGSPLINNFIEQIEIITGGYNAEHGRATGGVVNVVTKSGSNEFAGSVFSNIVPGFLRADARRAPRQGTSIDATTNLAYQLDFGFDLGGPIVKDKVWFYVGFAPQLARLDITKITKRRTDCRTLMPDGTLSACDPVNNRDGQADIDPNTGFYIYEDLDRQPLNSTATSYQFVSKINFAVAPEHQGQISLIGTPASGESVGVAGSPDAISRDSSQLTTDLSAKWTSKFNNNKTELEAVMGWHRSTFTSNSINDAVNDTPRQNLYYGNLGTWSMLGYESDKTRVGCTDSGANDPYPLIPNCPDDGLVGYTIGGPGGKADQKEERLTALLAATQRVKAAGNHEIKAGLDLESNRLDSVRDISGGVYYDVYLAPYNQTYSLRWIKLEPPQENDPAMFDQICKNSTGSSTAAEQFNCAYLGPNDVSGNTFNWAAYARDSWQPLPNLTFNYGVRYEEQRLRYAKGLQNTPDPFTGVERGTNAMLLKNMWAPRLGVLYDWTKEGRSKIYGHWGRFYESIPMDINDRSFGGETLYRQIYDSTSQCGNVVDGIGGASGPGCDENVGGADPAGGSNILGSGVLVAPGIKAQYLDEYILGIEYEVVEDLKVGLAYKNRRLGRILEDVSVDNADTYILANPGEDVDTSGLQKKLDALMNDPNANPDDVTRLQNEIAQFKRLSLFDKPRRDYNAIELTATKRFSRNFYAQGSYTYSRTQGNFGGLYSADNGQVDPNITSQFDLIELLSNRDGPLPQDRPHYIKLDGYYIFDFKKAGELTTGVRLRALSGIPINALGKHYLYGYNESFLLPRGAMGRTDFDYGADLHIGYGKKLGKGMNLEVYTDLFSIFNTQGTYSVAETYTLDESNPIVGGQYEDLVFLKKQTQQGGETADPVGRYVNFLNTTSRYTPFYARLGARLTF